MAPALQKSLSAAGATKVLEHSLQSSVLELQYERSAHLVDIISKDEDLRTLRFDMHILKDDNDELRDLLAQEEERSDAFEKIVADNLLRAEEAEARLQQVEEDLRLKEQEVGTLQAEAKALQTTRADSEAFLTEKLALTRELSILRPELAHLKEQAASTEALMTEKLDLQRQLTEVQCELENAKRDVKRAMAKRRNTGVEIAQEEQVEDLKRQLAKEKRARQRAEEAVDATQSDIAVDEVRKELAREKRARQKAEDALEAAQENTQVEDVRRDLLKEKKSKQKLEEAIENLQAELEKERKAAARATQRAEGVAETDDQVEELQQELAKEKKERAKAERALQKSADEYEAQRLTLEDKLGQFRAKLKTTKEKLKDAESELSAARDAARLGNNATTSAVGNVKKRNASHFDPEATNFGTPGDGPTAKRGRKAPLAAVGEKSTFSITPFLNRTINADLEDETRAADEEGEVSMVVSPSAAATQKQQALAPAPAGDVNIPKKSAAARQRKGSANKANGTVLEKVTEEVDEDTEGVRAPGKENIEPSKPATMKIKTKTTDGPAAEESVKEKRKKKTRKSLVDFATFNAEPAPEKKKKRKLGGLGKTLFDEEEDNGTAAVGSVATTKLLSGRTLLGGSRLGLGGAAAAALNKKAGGAGFLRASRLGASLLNAQDGSGFQFSPLKKQRRNLDDTLRG